eukprot:s3606_g7.t1
MMKMMVVGGDGDDAGGDDDGGDDDDDDDGDGGGDGDGDDDGDGDADDDDADDDDGDDDDDDDDDDADDDDGDDDDDDDEAGDGDVVDVDAGCWVLGRVMTIAMPMLMVTVRPSIGLEMGASYEDRRGNLAHSSKEYEAPGEWEHRVSCFRGRCPDGPIFGLDDFTVPAQGGVQDSRPPELIWALYPAPEQAIFRHENLVLQFSSVVSPHPMGSVMELCWNWTVHDDMLFVGDKVIINPPEDLVSGFSYNVSIQSGVILNFDGLRATAAGQFQYTFSVLAEAPTPDYRDILVETVPAASQQTLNA